VGFLRSIFGLAYFLLKAKYIPTISDYIILHSVLVAERLAYFLLKAKDIPGLPAWDELPRYVARDVGCPSLDRLV